MGRQSREEMTIGYFEIEFNPKLDLPDGHGSGTEAIGIRHEENSGLGGAKRRTWVGSENYGRVRSSRRLLQIQDLRHSRRAIEQPESGAE